VKLVALFTNILDLSHAFSPEHATSQAAVPQFIVFNLHESFPEHEYITSCVAIA
jgi:hypothetical protein